MTTLPTNFITDSKEGEITGHNTINPIITTSINNIDSNISCPISNFFKNECKKNLVQQIDKNSFKYEIISSISNGLLSEIISQVVNDDSFFMIKEGNEIYQISTVSNQMKLGNNLTNINFSKCEDKLKSDLKITNEELIIFKIEHLIEGYNIPIIEYAFFKEDGTYISLESCENILSSYYIPVSIDENNLFKHNTSSDYYNDECNKYKTESGTDITLYDRKNDYNEKHLSLCEANCTLKGYNSSTLMVECECKTRSYLYSISYLTGDELLE